MSKVTFEIEGAQSIVIDCNPGDNLLELARRANVHRCPLLRQRFLRQMPGEAGVR